MSRSTTAPAAPAVGAGRRTLTVGVLLAAGGLVLSACGGSPAAAPSPSATPTSTTTSTPTAPASATVPVQGTGVSGMYYNVLNWDRYGAEPRVQLLKRSLELYDASVNAGHPLPGFAETLGNPLSGELLGQVQLARTNRWHTPTTSYLRIERLASRPSGVAVVCLWQPTSSFYEANGKPVHARAVPKVFNKVRVSFGHRKGALVMVDAQTLGHCSGTPTGGNSG